MTPASQGNITSRKLYVDPNAILGDNLLRSNAKVRAYWDFTKLKGLDDSSLTVIPDQSVGGLWGLDNLGGTFTPKLGFLQSQFRFVPCLKALTGSVKQALATVSTTPSNLLKNSVSFSYLFYLEDGQITNGNYLSGLEDGGTRTFSIQINATGNIVVSYAVSGGSFVATSDNVVIANSTSGIKVLHIDVNFTTDVVSGVINGISIPFSITSGNIVPIDPSTFSSLKAYGVGGRCRGTLFTTDATTYKYILKHSVNDLLTDDEKMYLTASFLNY